MPPTSTTTVAGHSVFAWTVHFCIQTNRLKIALIITSRLSLTLTNVMRSIKNIICKYQICRTGDAKLIANHWKKLLRPHRYDGTKTARMEHSISNRKRVSTIFGYQSLRLTFIPNKSVSNILYSQTLIRKLQKMCGGQQLDKHKQHSNKAKVKATNEALIEHALLQRTGVK